MTNRTTKRQLQAASTKSALFDSALALFNEKGFNEVTIEEITQRAGTSKGSFYTYFKKKSDIIIEEFRTIDDYYLRWSKNLSRYPDALQKLLAFAKAQFKYVRDEVGLEMLKILYSSNIMEPTTEKILIDTSRYLHGLIKGIIEEGQASGQFRNDVSSDRLALLYTRGHRSVFLDWAISNNAFDLAKDGYEFCKVIICPALMAASADPPAKA